MRDEPEEADGVGSVHDRDHADAVGGHAVGNRAQHLVRVRNSERSDHRLADRLFAVVLFRQNSGPRKDPPEPTVAIKDRVEPLTSLG